MELLTTLKDTPLPTIFVIGGFIFIFLGIATIKKPIVIDVQPQSNRRLAIIFGFIFVITGLYSLMQSPSQQAENTSTETPTMPVNNISETPTTLTQNISPEINTPIPTATQSIIIEQTAIPSDCFSTEYVAPITGVHPPIDTVICVPSGAYTWISSDPAQFSIPSISYNQTFNVGYTFFLFGPVKFTVSGVQSKYIWMDTRNDVSMFGHLDEKSLNLIYQDSKVCDLALYAGTACP